MPGNTAASIAIIRFDDPAIHDPSSRRPAHEAETGHQRRIVAAVVEPRDGLIGGIADHERDARLRSGGTSRDSAASAAT